MGGGGGSDNYEQKQAETEAKKQAARDALNYQFGVGNAPTTTTYTGTSPNMADYWSGESVGDSGSAMFDQAGYDKALAAYKNSGVTTGGEANPNAGARDTLYQTVRDNAYNAGKRGLDETKDSAGRALKFELFAKGLNGGSEDINQNALLGRTYSNGLLDLGGKADAAKANFKGNDETTRLNLLQSIDAGMDQGSALSSATAQLQNNNDQAAADATGTTLGDLFANTALISNQSQYRQGKQAGTEWFNNYAPTSGRSTKASTGMITGV
ncbi:hypothetical protein RD110_08105 [Rhodoferax koreense]|uniref:Uncharacterized protein n=1 Tax=Rhodoferax koreensis TaxID=1842727 RepID=A0A1P8JTR5_9BURK|nr:hypothetical protein [Rhodoferax koreense]APW37166.1 hypothetical protein RD110_08105 [Rhodoferax koreense]